MENFDFRSRLNRGLVIPAHPLALNSRRKLDERRQRALSRYYIAAGAGGLAVGVHTTQFAIRDPKVALFRPVLELAAEEMGRAARPLVRIAGICGEAKQALAEAELVRSLGYHAGLLSLAALRQATEKELLTHCRSVARVLPVIGFYLQPAVGGRVLPYSFWRRFAEIQNVVAIKIAPFNRYQTLDVIRAVVEVGRDDIALYTGNDDNIVVDLLTPFRWAGRERRIVGGLLGQPIAWRASGGVCEGNNLHAAGLPNVDTLGVRGGNSHSPQEFMVPASLTERAQLTALLLLNLAIFTVGMMLAFLRHDPHPFYEKAVNVYNKAQQKFLIYKRKYEAKKNEILRAHNKRLNDKRSEIKIIEEQIKIYIRELDGIDKKITTDRKNLVSALARKVMAYQHSNQKIRKTPPPDYFRSDLIPMIEELI